jgi:transcriptional regulator
VRVPAVDQPLTDAEWRSFVVRKAFGHLVAVGRSRDLPVAVPTPYVLEGDDVLAHVARDSPILDALREQDRAMLAVAGDVAFIPSAWKATAGEDPLLGIPTTYFAAVQLAGRTELVEERGALAALLRRQLGAFQPGIDVADPEDVHARRLGAICGIVLHVEDVQARFKFGGNVDEAHRRHVLGLLESRDLPEDRLAIDHVRVRVGPDAAR